MKTATVKELNKELILRKPDELIDLCLRLSKFRKENKEMLTYLLFESFDESTYIEGVKSEIDEQFKQINRKSHNLFKKNIRRILTSTRKYIRYSQKKQTEIDLMIYFCSNLKKIYPSIQRNTAILNIYNRLLDEIINKISLMHEDIQYDYRVAINEITLYK